MKNFNEIVNIYENKDDSVVIKSGLLQEHIEK